MKKIIAFAVAAMLVISTLAGCSGTTSPSPSSTPASTPSPSGSTPASATPTPSQAPATPAANEPKMGGTVIVSLSGDPTNFNPDAKSDDNAYGINQNIYDSLVQITLNMDVIPDLAKSWDFSEDGKEITFHLQENVKWHDGVEFTSDDVKWTFDTIIAEKGMASASLASVEEITCPDKNTVVFKLANPDSSIMGVFGWYGIFIMPKHLYEGTDWLTNPVNMKPVGTGPFKFVEYQNGVSVTIEKNPEYWGQEPYLDRVIYQIIPDQQTAFQAFVNGEVDILGTGVPNAERDRFDNDSEYHVEDQLWANRTYFTFNLKDGRFTDVKMRRAFQLALNLDEIFTKALKKAGKQAEYYVSPLYSWALNEDAKIPARNIEEAQKLLEECGYTKDANGIYLTCTVDTFTGFEDTLMVAQANLLEAGIEMKLNQMEYSAWQDKVKDNHDFEITMLAGYQGPDIAAVGNRVDTNGSVNVGQYSNARIDELLVQGKLASDLADRAVIYKEIQAIMAEELPLVLINENGGKMPFKKYIRGYGNMQEGSTLTRPSGLEFTWLDK